MNLNLRIEQKALQKIGIAILTGSLFSAALGLSLLAWLTLRKRGNLHTRQYC